MLPVQECSKRAKNSLIFSNRQISANSDVQGNFFFITNLDSTLQVCTNFAFIVTCSVFFLIQNELQTMCNTCFNTKPNYWHLACQFKKNENFLRLFSLFSQVKTFWPNWHYYTLTHPIFTKREKREIVERRLYITNKEIVL